MAVAALVLAGFPAGYDTALVAAAGVAILLVTRRVRPMKVYAAIDWHLLMLFVGVSQTSSSWKARGAAVIRSRLPSTP